VRRAFAECCSARLFPTVCARELPLRSAYVSIRQHMRSAYVRIRQHTRTPSELRICQHTSDVSIRKTSALRIRQHTSDAYVSIRQNSLCAPHTSAYVRLVSAYCIYVYVYVFMCVCVCVCVYVYVYIYIFVYVYVYVYVCECVCVCVCVCVYMYTHTHTHTHTHTYSACQCRRASGLIQSLIQRLASKRHPSPPPSSVTPPHDLPQLSRCFLPPLTPSHLTTASCLRVFSFFLGYWIQRRIPFFFLTFVMS
jgi:hypothetical protein